MAVPGTRVEPAPAPTGAPREVRGIARLDKRTKKLVKRLRRGDVAIIDHLDLDRVSAEDLIACGVEAVVNVAPSTSGRYPNADSDAHRDCGRHADSDTHSDRYADSDQHANTNAHANGHRRRDAHADRNAVRRRDLRRSARHQGRDQPVRSHHRHRRP